jgi:alkylated DNA repair dioxygenase AlkB
VSGLAKARAPRSPSTQADLFGPPLPAGLSYEDDVIDPHEEARLIAAIEASDLSPFQFQQWEGKRLTRSFGWTYDFMTGRFAPGDAIPEWLLPLRRRAASFAGLDPDALEQVLLIEYGVGAGIGWHKDRSVFEHVIGVSLGEPAVLRFRRRDGSSFQRRSVELAPRSIYHMSGNIRDDWEHSIAAMDAPRWSVTFRSLR